MSVQDIPLLQWSQRNEARRLVTLIDTLYDMRCRLECSAAGKPRQVHHRSLHFGSCLQSLHTLPASAPEDVWIKEHRKHCSTCMPCAVHADTLHALVPLYICVCLHMPSNNQAIVPGVVNAAF